jgi:DNA-directed RNA polymerase subunit beta'
MDDFGKIEEKPAILAEGEKEIDLVEKQYQQGLLTDSERHSKVLGIWTDVKDRIVSNNKEALNKDGSVFAMIDSGARGSWGQLGQVIGMKGLVASPSGEIIELPVKGNFKEGFDVLEFFISSHGTRKGLSDTALRTANAGYLTRRLVDVAQDVVVVKEDCKDNIGEVITRADSDKMGKSLAERVMGRFVLSDVVSGNNVIVKAGEVITEKAAREIELQKVSEVHARSVLQCRLPKGICTKCYGYDLGSNHVVKKGIATGIIAAQSIGEPGTQLTMRTFHLGGIAGGGDITQGLPRVEELFEARKPKRQAVLSEVAGKVEIEDADGKIITSPTGRKIFEGRRGQKIIRVNFEDMDELEWTIRKVDEVKVIDAQKVKKGEILMVKGDSGEEIVAEYSGIVNLVKKKLVFSYQGKKIREYVIPIGYKLWVNDGDEIEKGDQLTEGSVHLQELYELKGKEAVQRYILSEIQEIYSSQGQRLNDKHIEIISRVYVEDPGDTDLLPGETVEKAQLMVANIQVKKEKGKLAKGRELFLGISKVSLSTQSFLSAASFQETARVLINAAITGKIDYLSGLKENVIIGRLIPVGTGFEKEDKLSKGTYSGDKPADEVVENVAR